MSQKVSGLVVVVLLVVLVVTLDVVFGLVVVFGWVVVFFVVVGVFVVADSISWMQRQTRPRIKRKLINRILFWILVNLNLS